MATPANERVMMVAGIQSRRADMMSGIKLLTKFSARPPMVERATNVQNGADAVMMRSSAAAPIQSSGSSRREDRQAQPKTRAAETTATMVTLNFSLQISMRRMG